jgi:tRNA threonylcarbamoyladenosine biosynthesis protein TsaB
MKTLAFEQSTSQASLAISEDGKIIASAKWNSSIRDSIDLFTTLTPVLEETGISLTDIDVFASSLGPGSFTGIRIALTTAKTMALPYSKDIFAVSSGEILAQASGKEYVGVLGDARRNRLWGATFKKNSKLGIYEKVKDYDLFTLDKATDFFDKCDEIISTDYSRLEKNINEYNLKGLIKEDVIPTAETLCEIVYKKNKASIDSDKLEPVYLHPAVVIQAKKVIS